MFKSTHKAANNLKEIADFVHADTVNFENEIRRKRIPKNVARGILTAYNAEIRRFRANMRKISGVKL